jgi:hypothetical protein
LRIGRRGYEPSEQQGGHDSKMAHSIALQTVNALLASVIAIRRGARAGIVRMHYSSCLVEMP